ncbi:MAG: CPBP family intramembrane metalloprotease [Pirellulaceae bacterium]|nr:CPBP family intramembrane metalloprotease [Pirellulaceae bacterium]
MPQLSLFISLCSCTLFTWGWLLYHRFTGRRLLPSRPPGETTAWGPGHVLLAILSVPLFQLVAYSCMQLLLDQPIADLGYTVEQAQLQVAFTSAGVGAAFFSLWFIIRTTSNRWQDMGLGITPLIPAISLGLLAFFSFAAPSYLLNALFNLLDERVHPVVEALRESRNMEYFTYSCVSVVLLSPLYEEIICRLIMQGWLQAAFARLRAASSLDGKEAPASPDSNSDRPTCWPSILLSSLFFSILHLEAGFASVAALFLFAVGLGLIYQRSGRLLPCVVMHMSLNAFTMLALYLEITT